MTTVRRWSRPIVVDDPSRSTSRVHAHLVATDRAVRVVDAGSANGTAVAVADGPWHRLRPGEWTEINGAASIAFGNLVATFEPNPAHADYLAARWGPAYGDLVNTFWKANLSLPPVPEPLRQRLRAANWSWATRASISRDEMYLFGRYLDEATAGEVDDYVAISHGGQGVNSFGLTLHVVHRGLALFVQEAWGGVYADPARQRDAIARTFEGAARLLGTAAAAPGSGSGPRFVVAWSGLRDTHWVAERQAGSWDRREIADKVELFATAAELLDGGSWRSSAARTPAHDPGPGDPPDGAGHVRR